MVEMFLEGYFYILSRKHGFALDVYEGQTREDAIIVVWPQKFEDCDSQLWSYESGRIINKKSNLALDVASSVFKKDKYIVQKKPRSAKHSQEWVFDQGFICSKEFPNLVLDIRGDSIKGGTEILLYKRKEKNNLNQLWQTEPFHNLSAPISIPIHQQENFGEPRPGYGFGSIPISQPSSLISQPDDNNFLYGEVYFPSPKMNPFGLSGQSPSSLPPTHYPYPQPNSFKDPPSLSMPNALNYIQPPQ